MTQIHEYHRPQTLQAAVELLSRSTPVTRPLAGGTHHARGASQCEAVIDLRDLKMGDVKLSGETWFLGATATLEDLAQAESLPPALSRAARRQSPRNIRQRATLGGAIAVADSGPLLACLLALNSQVHLEPGARVVGLADCLAGPPETRWNQALIVALSFQAGRRVGGAEVARTPADDPVLYAAVGATMADQAFGQVSVAVGAAGQPLAVCPRVASLLEGKKAGHVSSEMLENAVEAIAWRDDIRASADYRRAMLPILVGRACADLQAIRGEVYHEG
jgi:carbon-monoxide dehydrogenase medium subunit